MAKFVIPSLPELLAAGVHFGHQSRRWHPKAADFIFTRKKDIHIIDLAKTRDALTTGCQFLYEIAKAGQPIIFVGTKRQAREIVKKASLESGAFYVTERWLGGTLTNYDEVGKNLVKLRQLKKGLSSGEYDKYTKFEQRQLTEEAKKLEKLFGGIENLRQKPGALFVVDIKRERTVVREAEITKTPVVAIVDTNSDPTRVAYPIPGNDDAIRSLELLVSIVGGAVKQGYQEAGVNLASSEEREPAEKLKIPVPEKSLKELDLPNRLVKSLEAAGIKSVAQLQAKSEEELSKIKGLGPKSLTSLKKAMAKLVK
ncbi:MAG: 30S ribosomal protein S2 [bacterium]|nr:30S ribosomal protein S2 [bacterium]